MKNNNINWGLLIGVFIVVAVVASIISAGITGNVIKVKQDKFGKYQVYTVRETYNKSEIDKMIASINFTEHFCIKLYSLAIDSVGSTCFNREYNKFADINKDGKITPVDLGIIINRNNNESWCESQLIKRDNPCLGYPSYPNLIFDIDDDSIVDNNTDGKLILRYLFDFEGPWVIEGALGVNAKRNTKEKIMGYFTCLKNKSVLDVDGDGKMDALSDGILIVRYISGFPSDKLANGAISRNATRTTSAEVLSFLNDPPGYDRECDQI